jgi:FkbM family methyltransferase
MNYKIIVRKFVQFALKGVPKSLHRYILSCYQQVPSAFRGTGYEVLLNLQSSANHLHSSSSHYLRHHQSLLNLCGKDSAGIIFDVGANIGQTANDYTQAFPFALIHSFEPFRENFDHLVENTKLHTNIKAHLIALSDGNGSFEVKRDLHPLSQWNSLSKNQQEKLASQGSFTIETVQTVTGDHFCEQEQIERIELLKIDTEGHELEVLNGFNEMISTGRIYAILLEVGFAGDSTHGNFKQIHQHLSMNGLELMGFHDPDYKPDGSLNFANAFYARTSAAN